MIKFITSNGTYISIPGNAPEDLALAGELIQMSIGNEARILTTKANQLCAVFRNMAARKEGGKHE